MDRSGRGGQGEHFAGGGQRCPGQSAPGMRRRSDHEVGISASSVGRIWREHGLKPHLKRTFKLSNDPQFEAKFWDVVGLYLDPPEKSIVLCCDEKTQIQALERTQPGLPLAIGHIRTETHDYHRHGTITLFAAMNYLDGKLIKRLEAKHTHVEWLRFLKQIDRETPTDLTPCVAPIRPQVPACAFGTAVQPALANCAARSCAIWQNTTPTPDPTSGLPRAKTLAKIKRARERLAQVQPAPS